MNYTPADIRIIIYTLHLIQALSLAWSVARWQSPLKTWYGYLWLSSIVILLLRAFEFGLKIFPG